MTDSLEHYGVKGMHWGVRKDRADEYNKEGKKFAKLYAKSFKADQRYNKGKRNSLNYARAVRAGKKVKNQYDKMYAKFSKVKFSDVEKSKLNMDYVKQGNQFMNLHSLLYGKTPYYIISEYSSSNASYEDLMRWRKG